MEGDQTLSLHEWVVLALIDEAPTHGFAIAALTGPGDELGRIWSIPRPVVYRGLGSLAQAGLIRAESTQAGRGPQRTIYAITAPGRRLVRRWLQTPVEHVRDMRSHLLLKLALLHRRGADPVALLASQRAALAPIVQAVALQDEVTTGFDRTLLAWRRATSAATVAFLDDVVAQVPASTSAQLARSSRRPRADSARRRLTRSNPGARRRGLVLSRWVREVTLRLVGGPSVVARCCTST